MTIFVCDVSSYQPNFNFALAVQQDASGFIVKATQGTGYVSPAFASQLARALATGKPTSAYHYVEIGDAAGQMANILAHVPAGVPVILDTENGGDLPTTRAIAAGLRAAGRVVPLGYIPAWWLGQHGGINQSTADIAPLWDSRYPDNSGGSLAAMYARAGGDSSLGWVGYGGNEVRLYQFGSTVSIGGYAAIDASAFKGTEQDLRALFTGSSSPGPITHAPEEDGMPYWVKNSKGDTLCIDGGGMIADVDGSGPPAGALVWTVGDNVYQNYGVRQQAAAAAESALAALPARLDALMAALKSLPVGAPQPADVPIVLHGTGSWTVGPTAPTTT
jgi:hypothetical protein